MTHLHIADGVLPLWLWLGGLVLAAIVVGGAAFRHRHDRADRLTLLGALCAVMLAAMAVPLGPLGHLSFAPVVGILLGPGLGVIASALVNGTLALLGHGGLTVVGLNTLVLSAGTAVAQPAYLALRRRMTPGRAGIWATVLSLVVSVAALCAVVALSARNGVPFTALGEGEMHGGTSSGHALSSMGRFALYSSPFWAIGLVAESLVTASVLSYLARVRPELLP